MKRPTTRCGGIGREDVVAGRVTVPSTALIGRGTGATAADARILAGFVPGGQSVAQASEQFRRPERFRQQGGGLRLLRPLITWHQVSADQDHRKASPVTVRPDAAAQVQP
jgi:hypothetical protein